MRHALSLLAIAAAGVAVSGCVAKLAWDVVTLPVEVASATVDALTTSQSEADEKRGRELREADEKRGRDAEREARAQAELARRDADRLEDERRKAEREERKRRKREEEQRERDRDD
jgi:hypothetical protein